MFRFEDAQEAVETLRNAGAKILDARDVQEL